MGIVFPRGKKGYICDAVEYLVCKCKGEKSCQGCIEWSCRARLIQQHLEGEAGESARGRCRWSCACVPGAA
jgi:hypothetical protein